MSEEDIVVPSDGCPMVVVRRRPDSGRGATVTVGQLPVWGSYMVVDITPGQARAVAAAILTVAAAAEGDEE